MKRGNPATDEHLLQQCLTLVLPYLPPRDLAAAACTCRSLSRVAGGVTSRRSADAGHGFERYKIPFSNPTVSPQPYSYFIYNPHPILHSSAAAAATLYWQPWGGEESRGADGIRTGWEGLGGFGVGCECDDECEEGRCPCWSSSSMELGVLRECGRSCACGVKCGNRTTQSGIRVGLRVVRDERKGWGLRADEDVRRGGFVCEYAGEYLTTEEANTRLRTYDELSLQGRISPALLVVREHLPSGKACLRVNIDATKIGNVARFINHSCDGGNLNVVLVRNSGSLLPRLCFFAMMDISEGDELTFSYGESRIRKNGLPCFCESANCLGVLPSEET